MNPEIKQRLDQIRSGKVPPGYKKTKVGIIPEEWEIKKLGKFIEIRSGESPSKFNFVNNGLPYYKVDSLNNSSKYQNESDYYIEYDKKYNVKKGSLIFPKRGAAILLNKIRILLHESFMDTNLMTITVKTKINNEFLYYYLLNEKLYKIADTSTIPQLNNKHINPYKFPFFPLPEQRRIAEILSTWDKAIELKEKLLEKKKLQKKGLMQQLLTGKIRTINPDTGKPFEGEWREVMLGNVAKITKGKAIKASGSLNGEYPVIAGGKISPYLYDSFSHENVVTVSASGAYAGYVSFHKKKIWASDCSVIEEKINTTSIILLKYYLKFIQNKIYSLQSGGAQPHVYPKDLSTIKSKIANLKEQQTIASILTQADQEIELIEKEIEQLKEQKRGLLQLLLTGVVRV
jgi:type I restriction enzyme S subunit